MDYLNKIIKDLKKIELSHTETEQDETYDGEWEYYTHEVSDGVLGDLYCKEFKTLEKAVNRYTDTNKYFVNNICMNPYRLSKLMCPGCPIYTDNGVWVSSGHIVIDPIKDNCYIEVYANGGKDKFKFIDYKTTWWLDKKKNY